VAAGEILIHESVGVLRRFRATSAAAVVFYSTRRVLGAQTRVGTSAKQAPNARVHALLCGSPEDTIESLITYMVVLAPDTSSIDTQVCQYTRISPQVSPMASGNSNDHVSNKQILGWIRVY